MKASELVADLLRQIEIVGDIDVVADDKNVVIVTAYDAMGRSLRHGDPGATVPTHIYLHLFK